MAEHKVVNGDVLLYYGKESLKKTDLRYAAKGDVKTKLSEMTNDDNYVQDASYVHTDANFTAAEKAAVDGWMSSGVGDRNVIETVKVNGVALTPDTQKAVDIGVPTATSDLTNDSDFVSDANYVHTDANFTAAEKTKLSGIAEGAQANVIETITVNGTAVTPTNKTVAITTPSVPTDVSAFNNDAGYQTETQVDTKISTALASVYRFKGSVANRSALPSIGQQTGDVYNLEDTGMNVAWDGENWDDLGGTIDLTGYVQDSDIVAVTNAEVDSIITQIFVAA